MSNVVYKERKNTNCAKWDACADRFGKEELLPLWVADMDFEVPSCVKDALRDYVEFGIYGYYHEGEGYKKAFIDWERTYHSYEVKPEWIRFAPGVVPAINWLLNALTEEGDAVIISSPVYYPFKDAIINNNRKHVDSPLVRGTNGYTMDFEDFESKIVENDVKAFILCSPHNPVGRVWHEDEIKAVLDICKKHGVYVIADEIHQDIIMSGFTQITAATTGDYDDILVTVTAPSKTFNIAGCQNSMVIIPDEKIRNAYDEYQGKIRVGSGNPFGYIAAEAAYEGGRKWLDEVIEIIEGNYNFLKERLESELENVWIPKLEGTYLMWIGLGEYVNPGEMVNVIQDKAGLAVDYGDWFGGSDYEGFIRVNLATSRENIELAADRIIAAVK